LLSNLALDDSEAVYSHSICNTVLQFAQDAPVRLMTEALWVVANLVNQGCQLRVLTLLVAKVG
jgi:hypothetical protein